ncbi:MAG: dihydroxyacetone kinase subunit L [Planctomycetes bacterium GWF2_41_51]|nr:MAG: dihydroxyacetone kinase subunit L [Planctomycetes bacterium GWF2_41_51]HBG25571.1 dihydroxyacetone kinase subunit L [Phycisphaerales bacterium]
MQAFLNTNGSVIVEDLITVIQENRQYLSDIDGAIGDGDHGINMNKGFTLCAESLKETPGDLTHCLNTLSKILMTKIGGSMGPLYGFFFQSMAKKTGDNEKVNGQIFGEMLNAAVGSIQTISDARVGDKTLLDVLVPAAHTFNAYFAQGSDFLTALHEMKSAAIKGRDSTKEMIAKKGRASRLGERSRGVLDAGATSCCLILCTMADSIKKIIK